MLQLASSVLADDRFIYFLSDAIIGLVASVWQYTDQRGNCVGKHLTLFPLGILLKEAGP